MEGEHRTFMQQMANIDFLDILHYLIIPFHWFQKGKLQNLQKEKYWNMFHNS